MRGERGEGGGRGGRTISHMIRGVVRRMIRDFNAMFYYQEVYLGNVTYKLFI